MFEYDVTIGLVTGPTRRMKGLLDISYVPTTHILVLMTFVFGQGLSYQVQVRWPKSCGLLLMEAHELQERRGRGIQIELLTSLERVECTFHSDQYYRNTAPYVYRVLK